MKLEIGKAFEPLFYKCRYKIFYGGRGGAKSWGFAQVLLLKGVDSELLIACAREFQTSISQSVHKLLSDTIQRLNLEWFYIITDNSIKGLNGTEFIFIGLARNTGNIKSLEGADIVWIEEAENVSDRSWEVLIPTIRKPGSEIWISFNPFDEFDPTYQRFVMYPPEGALVVKVNWRDNKWFPEELKKEKDELKKKDYKKYRHIWEGECLTNFDKALIQPEWVTAARTDEDAQQQGALVLGVDPARFGDDRSSFIYRRGRVAFGLKSYSQLDTMQVTGLIVKEIKNKDKTPNPIRMVFVDVGGLGAGVVDRLRELGYGDRLTAVNSANRALDFEKYGNKRAEMWGEMAEWFKEPPCKIPDKSSLRGDLCAPEYHYDSKSRLMIEKKENMKKRGLRSPDEADALALTFAYPVGEFGSSHNNFHSGGVSDSSMGF